MGTSWSQDEDLQHKQTQTQEKVIKPLQVNDANGEVCTKTRHQVKLPNRYEEILKYADMEMDKSSSQKLLDQLHHGVFLNQKKKKYWVDRNSNNCFMLFASDLLITWAEDTNHWHWLSIKESSDEPVLVAELLNVCWLEVHVKFNTINLTPRTLYQVVFVVMLKDPAYGWEIPVNLRLNLADGTRQERKECLIEKPRGRWMEIPVGEFKALPLCCHASVSFHIHNVNSYGHCSLMRARRFFLSSYYFSSADTADSVLQRSLAKCSAFSSSCKSSWPSLALPFSSFDLGLVTCILIIFSPPDSAEDFNRKSKPHSQPKLNSLDKTNYHFSKAGLLTITPTWSLLKENGRYHFGQ